jgi:hypothetical protein
MNYKHDHKTDNKESLWRFVRFTGISSNVYVCDYDNSHHPTLEAAVARRDFFESDAGKQDRIQREERRRIQREFDIARAESKARMSAERQAWRLEVCPFFEDGLEVYA